MIPIVHRQSYVPLSGGHFMVRDVTDMMIDLVWHRMSAPQIEEFEILYGKEEARSCFGAEIRASEHKAAFFRGGELTCLMWSGWGQVAGMGRVRTLGCVCSDFAIHHSVEFCKHSKEVCEAFMLDEPPDVKEIYVFITETFKQSRNWAVRFCGFKEDCVAAANGGRFVCYKHVIGED